MMLCVYMKVATNYIDMHACVYSFEISYTCALN